MITTWIFTGFGKSVHRVIWRGFWHCLEHCTSGLVIEESIRVLGPSYNSQKKTSFVQDSRISYWLQFVCPISPLLLYGFQSNLVSLERYFRGKSNAVCYEGRGLLFMENVGNYRNAPLGSFWRYWWLSNPDFSYLDVPPTCLGRSPSVWRRFGSFWGRNMTFTSRIPRVWVLLLWNGPVGLSFYL